MRMCVLMYTNVHVRMLTIYTIAHFECAHVYVLYIGCIGCIGCLNVHICTLTTIVHWLPLSNGYFAYVYVSRSQTRWLLTSCCWRVLGLASKPLHPQSSTKQITRPDYTLHNNPTLQFVVKISERNICMGLHL